MYFAEEVAGYGLAIIGFAVLIFAGFILLSILIDPVASWKTQMSILQKIKNEPQVSQRINSSLSWNLTLEMPSPPWMGKAFSIN